MKKSLLSVLIVLSMLVGTFALAVPAYAYSPVWIVGADVTASPGDSVAVPIHMLEVPDIGVSTFFLEVTVPDAIITDLSLSKGLGGKAQFSDIVPTVSNKVRMLWVDTSDGIRCDQEIAVVTVRIPESVSVGSVLTVAISVSIDNNNYCSVDEVNGDVVALGAYAESGALFIDDFVPLYGDANGDGKVNAKDVTAIMKAIVAMDPEMIIFDNSDVNVDEKVNAKDVTQLMKYIVGVTTVRLGHNDTLTVITPSTCVKHGTGRLTCNKCGDSEVVSLPFTAHTYTSRVTTRPTCVKTGVRTYTCTVCQKSYTEPERSEGHTFVNDKCTKCGKAYNGWEELYFYDGNGKITDERYVMARDYEGEYIDHSYPNGNSLYAEVLVEGTSLAYDVSFHLYKYVGGRLNEVNNTGSSEKKYVVYVAPEANEGFWDYGTMYPNDSDRIYLDDPAFGSYAVSCLKEGCDVEFYIYEDNDRDVGYYCRVTPGDIWDALNFLG